MRLAGAVKGVLSHAGGIPVNAWHDCITTINPRRGQE